MNREEIKVAYLTEEELEDIALKLHGKACDDLDGFYFEVESYLYTQFKYRVQPSAKLEVGCNIDTALIACLNLIRIDERIYDKQYNRARFSMSHELAHLVLHKEIIDSIVAQLKVAKATDEYKSIISFLPPKAHRRAEWQAQFLGGCLLAPKKLLKEQIEIFIKERFAHTGNEQLDGEDRSIIYHDLCKKFGMTKEAIITRISFAHLEYLFDRY